MILIFFDVDKVFFVKHKGDELFKSASVKIENYFQVDFNPDIFGYDEINQERLKFLKENIDHHEVQDVSTEYILKKFPEKFI